MNYTQNEKIEQVTDPVSGNGTVACKKQGVPRDL